MRITSRLRFLTFGFGRTLRFFGMGKVLHEQQENSSGQDVLAESNCTTTEK
jgi:hypothetical protein